MKTCGELRTNGTVAIIGAGPGGAAVANLLHKRGFAVSVFESDAAIDARPQGGSLDLRPDSGQRAIDAADLSHAFAHLSREDAKAFRMVDSYGNDMPGAGEETHEDAGPEIDRADLRSMLVNALPVGMIAWGKRVHSVTPTDEGLWQLSLEGGDTVAADLVIGADGIGSRVRAALTDVQPIYTGVTMVAAYIRPELWRGSRVSEMLGEGSVMFAGGNKTIFVQRCNHDVILLYYSMAVPQDWPKSAGFDMSDTDAVLTAVRDAYRGWSPEVIDMLTQVQDRFQLWPTSVMPPDYRWSSQPGITMLGDASHAMPPFTGKGVNLALLDALELADVLSSDPAASLDVAIARFEHVMQARTSQEIRACMQVGQYAYGIDLGFDLEQAG